MYHCTPHKTCEVINRGVHISSTQHQQHTAPPAARVHVSGRHIQGKSESPQHQRETKNYARDQYCTRHQEPGCIPPTPYTSTKATTAPANSRHSVSMHTIHTRRISTLVEVFMAETGAPYNNYSHPKENPSPYPSQGSCYQACLAVLYTL